MRKAKVISTLIVCLFWVNNIFAQYSWWPDYVPTIPADRRVDWRNAGDNEKPTSYNQVFNVLNYNAVPNDGLDDRLAIQNEIEAARNYISNNQGSYTAVYLIAGNKYYFLNRGIPLLIWL